MLVNEALCQQHFLMAITLYSSSGILNSAKQWTDMCSLQRSQPQSQPDNVSNALYDLKFIPALQISYLQLFLMFVIDINPTGLIV